MNYHVGRNGSQLGPFTIDQLRAGLTDGQFQPGDLVWCEGMDDWKPLPEVLAQAVTAVPSGAPPLPSVPQIPVSAMPVLPAKTSGLAVTSLVLGIMTMFCSIFTGIPAVITGIVALKRIGKSNGTLGGRGLAIGGLCCGGALLIFGTAFMAGLAVPAFNRVQESARIMEANHNAREIVIALKSYAGDHNGFYPDADKKTDPQTSNDAFRLLFVTGLLQEEQAFTAGRSPFVGDNNIGTAPDFAEALKARENHWAMTKGLTDSANGNAPLIFEHANVGGAWPPMWNCEVAGKSVEGRAWKSGKIIIARNDGSVMAEQLESTRGTDVPLKAITGSKDLFTIFSEQGEILDVLR